jgi:aryl-alcohol dehydrogenase-like predicted oxidoreductase
MDTKALGGQGLRVGAQGLGIMGMSDFYGAASEPDAIAVIHRALELGVTLIDTSDAYGPFTNEELLGRALRGHRDGVCVATKFGSVRNPDGSLAPARGDAAYVHQAADDSLRRLGVDQIDLYYQHRIDFRVPIEETFGAVGELVAAGKVRYAGICEAGADTIRRAHAATPLTAVQTEYSLWSRGVEAEVLPTLRELGIGFVPYSPLGRGFLTGQLRSRAQFEDGDFRASGMSPRFDAGNFEANLALVDRVAEIAERHGASPGQVALAWVHGAGEDVVPIPGTKRIAYLEENIRAADLTLTPEDRQTLARIFDDVAGERYAEAHRRRIEE